MCIFSNSGVKNEKISNSGLFCCDLFKHSTNYMEMSKLIAYILQVLGVFGILFFLYFESTALPFREAGLVFSILAGITALECNGGLPANKDGKKIYFNPHEADPAGNL